MPINESWGVPNLPDNPRERHYVQALYHLTKTLDPTRPVIGNDGWESVATDIIGIHDYDDQPGPHREALPRGRGAAATCSSASGRADACWCSKGSTHADQPLMLTEFGGIALSREARQARGATRVARRRRTSRGAIAQLLDVVRELGMLVGFCYTQFADTYQEANGLLYADRTPKIPHCADRRRDRRRSVPLGPTASSRLRPVERRRSETPVMHKRRADEARRRAAAAVRARSRLTRRPRGASRRARPRHAPNAHLRWHPLRARMGRLRGHRQNRTFLPPPEYNPLAPTQDPAIRPRCRRALGRRGVRQPVSDACDDRARSAGARRADRAGKRRLRGRRLHAGPDGVARHACRSGTSSC